MALDFRPINMNSSPMVEIPSEHQLIQKYNGEFRTAVFPVTLLFGAEVVFGLLGNLLTIYVFMFRYRACNFRYFVLSLALTDFICCVTTIPGEIVSQLFWFNYPFPTLCKIKVYFNQFTICSEALFLTVIAVDRYRKVCRPFGWQIRRRSAICTCLGMFFVSAMLAIQTPIFWGVHHQNTEYQGRNITVTVCETDEKYIHTKYPLAFTIFNGTLVSIALICMFVLYILIAKRLFFGHKRDFTKSCIELDDDTPKITRDVATGMESCLSSMEFINQHMTPTKNTDPNTTEKITGPTTDMNNTAPHSDRYNTAFNTDMNNTVHNTDKNITAPCTEKNDIDHNTDRNNLDPNTDNESKAFLNGTKTHHVPKFQLEILHATSDRSVIVRARKRTLIGFYLTVIFIITTVTLYTLVSAMANGVLNSFDGTQKVVFFFFLRLYFVNHVINPVVYGLLDTQFRTEICRLKDKAFKSCCKLCST